MKNFDIVIPLGPLDNNVINQQIVFTKKNIIGYRNIYVVTKNTNIHLEDCIIISEDIFPFSMKTIETIHGKRERNGWYLQQLLKLYSGNIIPGILDKYLVIDSDTFFIKPISFIKNDKCLYNYGTEYHKPYFEHMRKLHPSLYKIDSNKSGICHHMIFETQYINKLFKLVENEHNDTFYNIFLKQVIDYDTSGASEYEIYFNYMLKYHKNHIIIRPLKWQNLPYLPIKSDYDYVSVHWYLR